MQLSKTKYLERWKRKEETLRAESDHSLGAPARVVAEFNAKALRQNYLAIQEQVPGQALLPMVKANGYGHGAAWVARQLLDRPNLYGFGVATLGEGAELRDALGAAGRRARIFVFSGVGPWTDEKGRYCEQHHLAPVLSSLEDWNAFLKGGWPGKLAYELKFNTGMNRLGIPMSAVSRVAKDLAGLKGEAHPGGILSHLAIGEDPDCSLSRQQREKFVSLKSELAPRAPSAQFHLAASTAIWNQKTWGLAGLTDVVRPGLSLYGVTPWAGAPERGVAPVLTLRASVTTVHRLKPGESTGYGARFQVKGTETVPVAILGAGYGDGIPRQLSGKENRGGGYVWLGGREERVLGTISMDLCAVSAGAAIKPGDWAEILGPRVDIWAQAKAADTIPYELLTSVAARVQRIYG